MKVIYLNEIKYKHYNITPISKAIEKENIDIVKLLLANDKLDINLPYVQI